MKKLLETIENYLNADLVQIIVSNQRYSHDCTKIKIRPVEINNRILFQMTQYIGTKVYHTNYLKEEIINKLGGILLNDFKQIEITSKRSLITAIISKKGKATVKTKKLQTEALSKFSLDHNRKKEYLLEEGKVVPFLVDLRVMTNDGKIINSKYDKYRQINRYLEFIEDIIPYLPKDREINIIDFGCGKSYLTFAMYYYLNVLRNYDINVVGLDLKKDVIDKCNSLAKKYNYTKLEFKEGNIEDYNDKNSVDMVVTLHACDTATDYALHKAINWGAKVILSVPCCQHEVNKQIDNDMLAPILKYGLIKERMSALITDALRANILENNGYKTQILEFIDMEHTPKNILIRAIKDEKCTKNSEYSNCMKSMNIDLTLEKLFREREIND